MSDEADGPVDGVGDDVEGGRGSAGRCGGSCVCVRWSLSWHPPNDRQHEAQDRREQLRFAFFDFPYLVWQVVQLTEPESG